MARLVKQIFTKFPQIQNNLLTNYPKINFNVSEITRKFCSITSAQEIVDPNAEKIERKDLLNKINEQLKKNEQGRLFAIVHVAGKQFKVTDGDVVAIEGNWPPEAGDKIFLDKVLLCGSKDFTLIGRPLVQKGLVNVEATVIEKSLSHTKTHFKKKRRKQYMRINFQRIPRTFLRINKVEINGEVGNPPEVRGLEKAIF